MFNKPFLIRTLKFSLVGGSATIIYAVVAFALVFFGIGTLSAHTLAYIISLAVSYFGQKVFTFEVRKQHRRFGSRFIIATIFLAVSQFMIVWFMSQSAGVQDYLVLTVSTLYYPAASFLLHTFWTFKGDSGRGEEPPAYS